MSPAGKAGVSFDIPTTIATIRKMTYLYDVGRACGQLLHSIPSIVKQHFDHDADYHSKPRPAAISSVEFTAAVDANIRRLRIRDDCIVKFPNNPALDRKVRHHHRKCLNRCIASLETSLREALRDGLGKWMVMWTAEQTEEFNKGVDKSLTGMAWSRYPTVNVCLKADKEDWGIWLRSRCDELGLVEAKAGRKVMDGL
jgi:hypothetical protein